jgi:hypothetical protein
VGASGKRDRLGNQYSRKVQQPVRTRGVCHGRGRTVTCGDGRGWTCCRQMACKRSGVRISLAPLVRIEIRTNRTVGTAAKYSNGGPLGRRTSVRIDISRWRGLLARPRISVTAQVLTSVPPRQTPSVGICDTCRLVVILPMRAVSQAVTVAVFAGGLRPAVRCTPRSTPGPRSGRLVVRVRGSSPGLRSLRRMAPVRRRVALLRAGLRCSALGYAAAHFGAATRARGCARPESRVVLWAALITLQPPRRPPTKHELV